MFKFITRALIVTSCIGIGANFAYGAESSTPAKSKAIVLADQGYFFVNGKYIDVGSKKLMTDQMYVQYMKIGRAHV